MRSLHESFIDLVKLNRKGKLKGSPEDLFSGTTLWCQRMQYVLDDARKCAGCGIQQCRMTPGMACRAGVGWQRSC